MAKPPKSPPRRERGKRSSGSGSAQRAQTREALRSSEGRYRALFEHMPNGFMYCRLVYDGERAVDWEYLEVNRACLTLTGLGDLVGHRVSERIPRFLETNQRSIETYERVARTGVPEHFESYVPGLGRWFDISAFSPQPGYFFAVFSNITEHRATLEALRAREARFQELEQQFNHLQKMEAVGRLAGGVAHDFNNVLTVIQTYAELLADGLPDGGGLREDVAHITDAVARAQRLTRQLLAFCRQQVLQPQVLELDEVVGGMERLIRPLIGEAIQPVFHLGGAGARVLADAGQLEQIILNLAVNARDAMPDGGRLTLRTSVLDVDADSAALHELPGPGSFTVLAVTDTGHGMSPEVQARVFEPFFTTKAPGRGTGLGLATVFGIVRQTGGSITVYSEPGHGTTFRVYLPVAAGAAAAGTAPASVPRRGTETVLLAEDDDEVRAAAARILGAHGYTIIAARHGQDALARAGSHGRPIDLVITDVVMPEMDGAALVRAMRTAHPSVRALFVSGYAGDDILRHGVLESGVPFLEKPYTSAGLLRKVREVLDP